MVYIYLRVSTEKQTLENQRFEIDKYCKEHNFKQVTYVTETVSGTSDYKNRKLGGLVKHLKKGDILVASELSRLGRNLLMVMEILNTISKKGATVITVKDNFKLENNIESTQEISVIIEDPENNIEKIFVCNYSAFLVTLEFFQVTKDTIIIEGRRRVFSLLGGDMEQPLFLSLGGKKFPCVSVEGTLNDEKMLEIDYDKFKISKCLI